MGLNPCIDKDILGYSSEYSPDKCIVVPKKINDCFQVGSGFSYNKLERKFKAYSRDFKTGRQVSLGSYKTVDEAISARNKYDNVKKLEICEYLKELNYEDEVIERIINR